MDGRDGGEGRGGKKRDKKVPLRIQTRLRAWTLVFKSTLTGLLKSSAG